jgi:hypothetical protein
VLIISTNATRRLRRNVLTSCRTWNISTFSLMAWLLLLGLEKIGSAGRELRVDLDIDRNTSCLSNAAHSWSIAAIEILNFSRTMSFLHLAKYILAFAPLRVVLSAEGRTSEPENSGRLMSIHGTKTRTLQPRYGSTS